MYIGQFQREAWWAEPWAQIPLVEGEPFSLPDLGPFVGPIREIADIFREPRAESVVFHPGFQQPGFLQAGMVSGAGIGWLLVAALAVGVIVVVATGNGGAPARRR